MMTDSTARVVLLASRAVILTTLAGCASHPTTTANEAPTSQSLAIENPALVLPSPELLATADTDEGWGVAAGGWEESRNDSNLGAAGSAITTEYGVAEIRHYEFLRTTNGRPRNDSWTHSRSYQRRSGP